MPVVNLHTFEKRGAHFLVDKYGRRYSRVSETEHLQLLAFLDRHRSSPFQEIDVSEDDLAEVGGIVARLADGEIGEKYDPPADLRAPTLSELEDGKTVLHLHVTGNCNLRCPWCYTGEKVEIKLKDSCVRRSIDAITAGDKPGPFTIRFFGGEPLMNMRLIRDTVAYCESLPQKFDYSITTNGMLLNKANSDFLVEHNFLISISIMGYAEVHDAGRILPNGGGSYEIVAKRARDFLSSYDHEKVSANVTVPFGGFDYVRAIRNLVDLGFRKIKMVGITDGTTLGAADREREAAARRDLLDYYIECLEHGPRIELTGLSYDPYVAMIEKRNSVRAPSCRMHGQIAMDSNGNYLPCHRWMDEPFSDVSAMVKRQKEVIDAVSYDGCKSCWAEFVCGKGVCYWKKEHHEKGSLGPSQAQCRENGRLDLIESAYFVHDFLRDRTAAQAEPTPAS